MDIVVVGGGAGGAELATKLGRSLGRKKKARITLIDQNNSHVWKPLLHEVASGSLDSHIDSLSFRAHAHRHHFRFRLGTLTKLNRDEKTLTLAALYDENGHCILPERQQRYDILVLAIGSVTNDFGTPGVAEHCIFLDAPQQAERFHRKLLNGLLKLNADASTQEQANIRIAIVGGGATGVELSAELHNTFRTMAIYGLDNLRGKQLDIQLLEAGPRILPALPERISASAQQALKDLNIAVKTQTKVTQATEEGLIINDGELLTADLMVWAAGIKVSEQLKGLGGLPANGRNQWLVKPTLQTQEDDAIFAIGDCAACALPDGGFVPPRAQSAHQMADHAFKNIRNLLNNKPLTDYRYVDYGSLVNLSRYSTVGNLMGNLAKGSMMVEGRIARLMYISLYRMHQVALHGYVHTGLRWLSDRLNRVIRPRLKLH